MLSSSLKISNYYKRDEEDHKWILDKMINAKCREVINLTTPFTLKDEVECRPNDLNDEAYVWLCRAFEFEDGDNRTHILKSCIIYHYDPQRHTWNINYEAFLE